MTDAGTDADPREITGGDVTAQMGAGSHMHAFAEATVVVDGRTGVDDASASEHGADVDGALAVAIVPVSGMLNLKALAAALGGKRAAMADPALAERRTGYVVGGISPLGQRSRLRTVLDGSALTYDTVLVSGGRRGLDLELAPNDLVSATGAVVAEIGR